MSIKHSSASQLWYTPVEYIEAARDVLGGIDLDPASDGSANETVRATQYIVQGGEHSSRWPTNASVWLNPPGGLDWFRRSLPVVFWDALMQYRSERRLRHAIFLAFSIEQLQTTQRCESAMMSHPICIPDRRIRFVSPTGARNNPTHASAIVYVPGTEDRTAEFLRVFSKIGACKP